MTHIIKSLILSASLLFICSIGYSQLNVGAGFTYLERGNEIGVQGKAFYGWNDTWGAAGGFDYIFTEDLDFDINADVHYRFNIGRDARVHPLAGLNLAKYNTGGPLDIGINLGIFASMPIQNRLQLYVEPKAIIGGQRSFAISVGVMI